jgi:hypothetical protein
MGAGSVGAAGSGGLRLGKVWRFLALVAVLALLAVGAIFVINAVRDAQPGFRDADEVASALGGIEGYEASCSTPSSAEEFGGGSMTTLLCSVTNDGKPVTDDGVIQVQLITPVDAMDSYVSLARDTTERPFGSVVGENWVIQGLAEHDSLRADLIEGLDEAREDRNGIYHLD